VVKKKEVREELLIFLWVLDCNQVGLQEVRNGGLEMGLMSSILW